MGILLPHTKMRINIYTIIVLKQLYASFCQYNYIGVILAPDDVNCDSLFGIYYVTTPMVATLTPGFSSVYLSISQRSLRGLRSVRTHKKNISSLNFTQST